MHTVICYGCQQFQMKLFECQDFGQRQIFAVDHESCYDPLCKKASQYFNAHHSLSDGSRCGWYYWRQLKTDRNAYGEDWGHCLLKTAGYGFGYRIPSDYMLKNNFGLYVGNFECHQARSEYNHNNIARDAISKSPLLRFKYQTYIYIVIQLVNQYVCLYLILEYRFTYAPNHYCTDQGTIQYSHLDDAKMACMKDDDCKMVFSASCQGDNWKTCKGTLKKSVQITKSCTWIKGTG